jgi:hypothetical protein
VIVVGHIAGIPVEEWLLPWLAAGGALAGLRASFGRRAHRLGHAVHSRTGSSNTGSWKTVRPESGRPDHDIDQHHRKGL